MILIKEEQLNNLIGYLHTVLDLVDVDYLEDKECAKAVKEGYNDFVQPVIDILTDDKNTVDRYVIAKQVDVEIFAERLNDTFNVDVDKLDKKKLNELYDQMMEYKLCHECSEDDALLYILDKNGIKWSNGFEE